ncbi:MAG: hypothetical protein Q7U73_07435 [Rubrivivax sp.]|nr:hypothetical protein [Rubrivivax sp.]
MMDDLRLAAVAARVVAWHNRHPLARRISAAQVHAVGYVGLPFAAAAGADLAAAAADGGAAATTGHAGVAAPATDAELPALATLQPDFSEDFIDPLHPRAVARFAGRVGQVQARPPGDGPVRDVPADGKHTGLQPWRVYLLTAVIETSTRKSRVLIGTGLTAPVLGWRIFDNARVAALAGLVALVVGVPAWLLQPDDRPTPSLHAAARAGDLPASAAFAESSASPASAASDGPDGSDGSDGAAASATSAASVASAAAAQSALAAAPVAVPPSVPASATGEAVAPADVATASLSVGAGIGGTEVPAAVTPHARRGAASSASRLAPLVPAVPGRLAALGGGAPSIRPVISNDDKARARQARETWVASRDRAAQEHPEAPSDVASAPELARSLAPLPAPGPQPAPAPAQARVQPAFTPAATVAGPAPASATFALSTRTLRTRAEAEQVQVAMRSLLRTVGASDLKVDVLPQGEDWRVVALPFTQRTAADKARTLLVSRGMRVVVIDF